MNILKRISELDFRPLEASEYRVFNCNANAVIAEDGPDVYIIDGMNVSKINDNGKETVYSIREVFSLA